MLILIGCSIFSSLEYKMNEIFCQRQCVKKKTLTSRKVNFLLQLADESPSQKEANDWMYNQPDECTLKKVFLSDLDQMLLHQILFSIYGCFLIAHIPVHFSAGRAILLVITRDEFS